MALRSSTIFLFRLAIGFTLSAAPAFSGKVVPTGCPHGFAEIEINAHDLLATLLTLQTTKKPQLLAPALLEQLRGIANAETDAAILEPENFIKALATLKSRIGKDEFEVNLGRQALAVRDALNHDVRAKYEATDLLDLKRGWGSRLFLENDPAYRDPRYQADSLRENGPTGVGMDLLTRSGRPLYYEFQQGLAKFAPELSLESFTMNGTEANNSLYRIADEVAKKRGLEGPGEIIAFDGSYGGGGGKIQRLSYRNSGSSRHDELLVSSPTSTQRNPTHPAEIARLETAEAKSLREIEAKLKGKTPPVGGFLLETIPGASGVRFFRREFLLQLRQLCDEYDVPLIADEVLTGGRTSKLFAYQLYDGFLPDYVTFGKGLEVAGVARVTRAFKPKTGSYPYLTDQWITRRQYAEPLLKSIQILKRIEEGHFLDKSREVGDYFVRRLRDLYIAEQRENLRSGLHAVETELKKLRDETPEILEMIRARELQKSVNPHPEFPAWVERFRIAEQNIKSIYDSKIRNREKSIAFTEQRIASQEKLISDFELDPEADAAKHVRGIGALIYAQLPRNNPNVRKIETAEGRLLPPLTFTKEQVDQLFPAP